MSATDKKLYAVFKLVTTGSLDATKEQKAKEELRSILEKARDTERFELLWRAFTEVSDATLKRRQLDTKQLVDMVGSLRNAELVKTSALLFAICLNAGAALDWEAMLRLSPDAASVEAWRKKNRMPMKEFQQELLADVRVAYESAGGDWALRYGEANMLTPLMDLFLKRQPRPRHLPTPFEALSKTLTRDVKGSITGVAVRAATTSEEVRVLAEILLQRPVFPVAVESLAKVATQKDEAAGLVALIKEMCGAVLVANDNVRELLTAGLARIGTGILLAEKRGSQSQGVVEVIVKLGRQLEATSTKQQRESTWALVNLGVETESPQGHLHVTEDGARRIAVAFEKAAEGFGAPEVLTMLARNLGMTSVGKKGDVVRFDPLVHEDVKGGMHPGDSVVIHEPGWACGETVVVRAKVKA